MMPDYWKAYGNVATAVPIIVFQHEKIMIIELCFSPSYGADTIKEIIVVSRLGLLLTEWELK